MDSQHTVKLQTKAFLDRVCNSIFLQFLCFYLDSSRPIWWHILVIIIPPEIEHSNTPFLWITDQNNGNDAVPDALNYNILIAGMLSRPSFLNGYKLLGFLFLHQMVFL